MKTTMRLSTLTALFFSLNGFSQAPNWLWAKGIGGTGDDVGNSIATDASGNIYTTGSFEGTVDFDPGMGTFNLTSLGLTDIFISKFDSIGNFVWAKSMGGIDIEEGLSITIDASGNVYTTGYFDATVDFDPGVGIFNITSGGNSDNFISKLDSSGNFVWAKAMSGSTASSGLSITLDALGNAYTTGYFTGTVDFDPGAGIFNLASAGGFNIFISKLDSAGNFRWAKAMGGIDNSLGRSIALDAYGNVYTTGEFWKIVDFDPGLGVFNLGSTLTYFDIFISKLDSSGNFVWAKQIGANADDSGRSIAIDVSGSIYTTGYFVGTVDFDPGVGIFNLISAGGGGIFISKLDSSGNFLWAKAIVGASFDRAQSLVLDTAGSEDVYITGLFRLTVDFDPGAGVFYLTASGDDIFIAKLDSSGNFIWAKQGGGVGGLPFDGFAITLNAFGNICIAGYFNTPSLLFGSTTLTNASTNTYDIFIAKLDTTVITGNNETEKFISSITLSPNPFHETATLTINTNKIEEGTIEIKNILGATPQPPKHFTGNKIKLQRNNLPAGIYFYMLTTKQGASVNGKFIVD